MRKNRLSGNVYGISVSNGANENRITGNRVSSGPEGFSFGISVFSDSDRNIVTKNRVRGMAFEGLYSMAAGRKPPYRTASSCR